MFLHLLKELLPLPHLLFLPVLLGFHHLFCCHLFYHYLSCCCCHPCFRPHHLLMNRCLMNCYCLMNCQLMSLTAATAAGSALWSVFCFCVVRIFCIFDIGLRRVYILSLACCVFKCLFGAVVRYCIYSAY